MAMNEGDITKYKSLYLQTSWGYLNMLRKNVAFLLKGVKAEHAVDSAHLAAHSLKSQSILMGYMQIGKLSERIEKILQASKENTLILDKLVLQIMLDGLAKVQLSLTNIADNGDEVDMGTEIDELDKVGI